MTRFKGKKKYVDETFDRSKDHVLTVIIIDHVMRADHVLEVLRFLVESAKRKGFYLEQVQLRNIGNDGDGNPISNKFGTKARVHYRRIPKQHDNRIH